MSNQLLAASGQSIGTVIGAFRRCSELLQVKTPVVDKYGKQVLAMVTE